MLVEDLKSAVQNLINKVEKVKVQVGARPNQLNSPAHCSKESLLELYDAQALARIYLEKCYDKG